MKRFLLFSVLLGLCFVAIPQKKTFSLRDIEIGSRRELAPTTMQNLQWRGKSNSFTFQDSRFIYQQSVQKADTVKLISLVQLNRILRDGNVDTLANMPVIVWGNDQEFHFYSPKVWNCININTGKLTASINFPDDAENFSLYFPAKKIAYTAKNNLFLVGEDNKPVRITNDNSKDIVNGQTVSRNEFGINDGIFWSPNGNYIAFYRKDNSKVGNYPLVDITAREATADEIKYPMAGMPSENVSLGVYNITNSKTLFIERQDTVSEKYLTNITWSPDEQDIYIQVLNRKQDHMLLNKYRASDGSLVKTLFEEHNSKYVEPLHTLRFLNKNKSWFLYQSRRDGFNHLYVYDTEGKLIKQLTSGNWEVLDLIDVDPQDNVWFTSTEVSPIDIHGYSVNVQSLEKLRLTTVPGIHKLLIAGNFQYWIDDFSSTTLPHITNLMAAKGKLARNLVTASNPLTAFEMPNIKIGTIKAADGKTDLFYRLITPANLDSTKKYPAIIYVYGGPHDQLIEDRWLGGARFWDYMMAQKGYILLTVDNRGSENRGLEFENVIHRQCGVAEMQDQMEGVKLLKNLGYVDMKRLGVHGWSYGGFMTISLLTTYPDVFKVGVAGGPVIDWKYYEVMYGERYMDTPQENPEGYAATSLISKAKNLKSKLLIIHGGVDPTVVWQNSLVFIQECIKNQVPVDYFVYPRAEHNVRGVDRVHLMGKITGYFDDYLK
jgi:dipeptidyl-peptidase 4